MSFAAINRSIIVLLYLQTDSDFLYIHSVIHPISHSILQYPLQYVQKQRENLGGFIIATVFAYSLECYPYIILHLKKIFFFFYVEMIPMFTPNPTSFTFLKFLTSTQCQCYRAERVEGFNNCEAAARVCTSLKGPQPRKISLITRYHTKSGRDSSPLRLPTYLFPISNQKLDNGLETYYV